VASVGPARRLEFHPVTPERLPELERFSRQHGKFRYCSCMRWRMTSAEYQRSTKESRVAALEGLVHQGTPVGVLAYMDGEPVGWCSIAPRETYGALERFRALPRLDDAPVWAVVCFFVDRHLRRSGVTLGLLSAAVEYARSQGAEVIEGYPVEPGPRLYTYMGSPATFREAGFEDALLLVKSGWSCAMRPAYRPRPAGSDAVRATVIAPNGPPPHPRYHGQGARRRSQGRGPMTRRDRPRSRERLATITKEPAMQMPAGPYGQSCGMPLSMDANGGGNNADGSVSTEYCGHCWAGGKFAQPDLTLATMRSRVDGMLRENSVPDPMREQALAGLAQLKRWQG